MDSGVNMRSRRTGQVEGERPQGRTHVISVATSNEQRMYSWVGVACYGKGKEYIGLIPTL